jgi:hypothetical protein
MNDYEYDWCGQRIEPGKAYGGRPENIIDAPKKDRRQVITEADVAAIFKDGALPKAEAAQQLEANTGASRATCYRALDPKGRFAKRLKDENGMLSWRH